MSCVHFVAFFLVSLATSHGEIQLLGTPRVSSQARSGHGLSLSLGDISLLAGHLGSRVMVGEEIHISRDVIKLNGTEGPLWVGRRPPVGMSEGREDLAYSYWALPQPVFSVYEPGNKGRLIMAKSRPEG